MIVTPDELKKMKPTSMGWNRYYMTLAEAVAQKSKDPHTKVGSVVIDQDMRVVSTGYNGFPSGFADTPERWERPTKYKYVVHAEMNAILYARRDLRGCLLYTTLMPCTQCLKLIAAAGINIVVYKNELRLPEDQSASAVLAKEFGIYAMKWEETL